MNVLMGSVTRLCPFVTPWTVARQAPLSMGLPRHEYWSGLPFPPPGDRLDPGIEPTSPVSSALAEGFFTTEPLGKPQNSLTSPSLLDTSVIPSYFWFFMLFGEYLCAC